MEDLDRQLRDFLAADAREDAEAADRALARLFQALPAIEPAPDLVNRVMHRLTHEPADLGLAGKLATSAIFAFLALAWINLSPSTLFWDGNLEAKILRWASVLPGLARQADDVLVFGRLFAQLLDATFALLAQPPVLGLLLATTVAASLVSRCVYVLVDPRRPIR